MSSPFPFSIGYVLDYVCHSGSLPNGGVTNSVSLSILLSIARWLVSSFFTSLTELKSHFFQLEFSWLKPLAVQSREEIGVPSKQETELSKSEEEEKKRTFSDLLMFDVRSPDTFTDGGGTCRTVRRKHNHIYSSNINSSSNHIENDDGDDD